MSILSADEIAGLRNLFALKAGEGDFTWIAGEYKSRHAEIDDRSGDRQDLAFIHFQAGWALCFSHLELRHKNLGKSAFARCRELEPENYYYCGNYIRACLNNGDYLELLEAAREMVAKDPLPQRARPIHEILIYVLSTFADEERYDELRTNVSEWMSRYIFPRLSKRTAYRRRARRPLRVGFLHYFFDRNAYHGLFIPLLAQMERSRIISHCYSTCPDDALVAPEMRNAANRWRAVGGMSDEQVCDFIAADGLDILVNLDGFHTVTRFDVFARRPAPIAVTWHNTSHTFGGLFDYIIADDVVVPQEHEPLFAETVARTPNCYFAMESMMKPPRRGPMPALSNGYITFGSLNRPEKINPALLGSWQRVMDAVPDSRLVLRNADYSNPHLRAKWLSALVGAGIAESRMTILPGADDYQFADTYNAIDIALDSFPFNGGTTTYQALWMGVPTVTWAGPRWAGRVSASILTHAGLPELVAESQEAYESLAIRLATEPDRLQAVRMRIDQMLADQPHLQTPQFAQDMMGVFEWMAADYEARTANL